MKGTGRLPGECRRISILYMNARSIANIVKFNAFQSVVADYSPSIIAVTETWCSERLLDGALSIPGFTFYRCDRINRTGGGVLIYVSDEYTVVPLPLDSIDGHEFLFCNVNSGTSTFMIGAVYRPPAEKVSPSLCELLDTVGGCGKKQFVVGDFNLPRIDWNDHIWSPLYDDFMDTILNNRWEQMIRHPTREDNVLDLFFTNDPNVVESVEILPPIISDHCMILATLNLSCRSAGHQTKIRYNYRKADWIKYRETLECFDWGCLYYQRKDVDDMLDTIVTNIWTAVRASVPQKQYRQKNRPIWDTAETQSARHMKRDAERAYKLMQK